MPGGCDRLVDDVLLMDRKTLTSVVLRAGVVCGVFTIVWVGDFVSGLD